MAAAHPFGAFVGCRFKRIGIAHFARLQETTSQCALTLCHAVFRVLRVLALLGPALRPPASQCAPGLTHRQCKKVARTKLPSMLRQQTVQRCCRGVVRLRIRTFEMIREPTTAEKEAPETTLRL